MIYLIEAKINGISYYVRVKNINAFLPHSQFEFEGLKNNATEFSQSTAAEALLKIKTDFELKIVPRHNR